MRWLAALLAMVALVAAAPTASAVPDDSDVVVQGGTGFSDEQLATIRSLVEESKLDTRVRIVRQLPKSASYSSKLHAEQLVDKVFGAKKKGLVLVFSPEALPEYGGAENTEAQDVIWAMSALESFTGTPQEAFVALVQMSTTRTGREGLDQALADQWDDIDVSGGGGSRHDQPTSTTVKVLRVVVGLVIAALVGAFLWFRLRAASGSWRRHRRAKGLEEAADKATTKNLAEQARADVLAFGEAIDSERMDEHDALQLWNLALEDYDKASRLLDARKGPADDRKVIEVCARGRERLRLAQR